MNTASLIAKFIYSVTNTVEPLTINSLNFHSPKTENGHAVAFHQTNQAANNQVMVICDDPNTLALVDHILSTETVYYVDMITEEDVYPEELENGTFTASDFPAFTKTTIHLEKLESPNPRTLIYKIIAMSS